MADDKAISELPVAGTLTGTELVEVIQSSANVQTTTQGIANLASPSYAAGIATFLNAPSSANLAAAATDETGTGLLVFNTSPVLVTPSITTAIIPTTDDGAALGSLSNQFSDLFLASGGVINFAVNNAVITHSSGLITVSVAVAVPDEAYGVGWNGSLQVPTKNAVYDKIETLGGGGISGLTTGTIPKAASSSSLSDSLILQSASNGGHILTTRAVDVSESGTSRMALIELTQGAGTSINYQLPLEVRATVSGGTAVAEYAVGSFIGTQSGGVTGANEGIGVVIGFTGGTTGEVRGFNSTVGASSNVGGSVIGMRNQIGQTGGTIAGFIRPFSSQVVQDVGTTCNLNIEGMFTELNLSGTGSVRGSNININIIDGTHPSVYGAEISVNLTGGSNTTARGLVVNGPNGVSADPEVARFTSRMAISFGVLIVGHASQSQDLFNVFSSGFANRFKVTAAGNIEAAGSATAGSVITGTGGVRTAIGGNGFQFTSGGFFICSSSGVFKFSDSADTSFGRLQFGGTTSSFPALKRSTTGLLLRLADDSAYGFFDAGSYKVGGVAGIDFSGSGAAWAALTTVTFVKGILTAAS